MSSVTSFFPVSAYAGDTVRISGNIFTGATEVTFGGIDAASFMVVDDSTIDAVVAVGSADGDVAISGPAGSGANAGFTYLGTRPGAVKVKMPASPPFDDGDGPVGDDLVWVWDVSTAVLRKSKVSDLPFSGGGGGTSFYTAVPSPFMVFAGSDNYSYDAGTNSVKIRDARLLNKTQYPVATTQFGAGEFDTDKFTYNPIDPDDPTLGNVVIPNFQLDVNSHITITVPGARDPASDTQYAQLLADVALLKQFGSIFMPTALGATGAKVWYTGDVAALAGTGWQECEEMRGLYPMAQNPDDDDFKGTIGTGIGDKTFEIAKTNLPAVGLNLRVIRGNSYSGGGASGAMQYIDPTRLPVGDEDVEGGLTSNMGDGTAIKFIPESMLGMWIEFVGIG